MKPALQLAFVLLIFFGLVLILRISNSVPSKQLETVATDVPDKAAFDLELVKSGWKRENYVTYITGTVRNNSPRACQYAQINFNLYDASGAQVGVAFANTNNLEPGGLWRFKAVVSENDARTFQLKELTGF